MVTSEKPATILVVEDEERLAASIMQSLIRVGYGVNLALDGEEAMDQLGSTEPSLVILDLTLPKRTGLEVLASLRAEKSRTPVLILSAMDRVEDRVRGLQLGADDYLGKPFEMTELLARIEALLRRAGYDAPYVFQADDLTLDVITRKVTRGNDDIPLSPKQFALLEFLLRHKNQILSRRRIAEQIWGYTFDTGTNLVDVHIKNLRKSIDRPGAISLILTVHGEGYVLRDA